MSYDYQKIDKLIEESGLERRFFFAKVGIAEKYYNSCKSGQVIPKEGIMRRIANKLNVPIQEIKESLNAENSIPQADKYEKDNTDQSEHTTDTGDLAHTKASHRMIRYISSNIDTYLSATTRKERHTAASRLRQKVYKSPALQIVRERLSVAPESVKGHLLMLLFSIDREQNILFCLDELLRYGISLDSVSFFKRIETNPLTENEQKEVAKHIGNNPKFDVHLLNYIHGESLDYALDRILSYSMINGLTSKRLLALSYKREYLYPVQKMIREKISSDAQAYQNWMKYLDLSISENQCVIDENYTLLQIFQGLRATETAYHDSDYFSVRVVQRLLHKISIDSDDWYEIKMLILQEISITNIDENKRLIDFLRAAYYVDTDFSESMLITLYKKTTLYSKAVLEILASVQSPFAYREMVNILLTTNDPNELFRIARYLIKCFPHKSTAIIEYIKTLNNDDLLRQVTNDIRAIDQKNFPDTIVPLADSCNEFQIIPRTMQINELLLDLAKQINADTVYAAVGFAFASGLRTLSGLIEYVNRKNGKFELIVGALQNHNTSNNRKIDRQTVQLLNSLINNGEISLYTYENSFYHGKFYYIGSATQAYVVVGSSNISKTAFLENYELDVLFKINPTQDNAFLRWYEQFKVVCTHLPSLNEANFLNLKWDSELNVFTEKFIRKLSHDEIIDTVNALSDEEVKSRILTWLKYKPTDYYSDLEIPALEGYTLFLYETYSLGVFESFSRDNAYYVFRCISVEQLLAQVAQLTKTEMANISIFIGKGYHIQNQDRLQDKISKFFERR